ncbi:hypothetical protein [Spirochaeta isovalerica]|uniref:DUF1611 domain-containing protein n=1 Tax=Spirochaeta isovalerica TaxID=150 RepID=A0A841R8I9_9SPIO|nr:hypothetical protein [Spirochaeta isovalerica]MBB6479350.1 hypothetical protein [Spirochaeta isovalerica]
MKRIEKGYIFTSGAYALKNSQIKFYTNLEKVPEAGDVVYGEISHIGQHSNLENKSGRIHKIHNGTRALFVFADRYAPDYYEAFVPEAFSSEVDLLARSGLIGEVKTKNSLIKDPSRVMILGYLCDEDGQVINTKKFPAVTPRRKDKVFPRAKMILVCGTAMNSGKSVAAASICWALSKMGHTVKGSKVTGTASLKDILHMNDAGADSFSDFTYLGFPTTYMLKEEEIIGIFNDLDLKYANNPQNYWVVEFADGINQRETEMLLRHPEVRKRIHRLVFCANDAFGAIGGIEYLKERLDLVPDLISGVCTSSPLHMRELGKVTHIPIFDSMNINIGEIKERIV